MDLEILITTLIGGHPGYLTAIALLVASASVLDALLPQPGPDSPWLPARKLMSAVAANVLHASNAGQPPLAGALAKIAEDVLVGQGVRPDPEPTHGEVIRQLAASLNPADPAAYAAGMARIAEVAGRARAEVTG